MTSDYQKLKNEYWTRDKILESSNLFTISDTNFIKNSTLLTLKEKRDIIIDIYSKDGFTVNNLSDTKIQFKKGKSFSLFWATLWLLVFLVGLLVYIFYYMSKSDDIVTVTLDPSNCKKDEKKDDMLEKELINKEEFENLKSELLKIKE